VNVFLDNGFISTSKLPAVYPGGTFDAPLGVDNGVAIERRLVNRLTELSGVFSKTQKVHYEIALKVENKKKIRENITVVENVPVSQDERIKVVIEIPRHEELAPDAKGILTWEFSLAPGERREFKLQYYVEFPPQINVAGLE
jgi:uncharacterized protein (TIGR02231 family)